MQKRLNHNAALIDTIIPDFPVGCRRLTPGPGFLEALVRDNVEVVSSGIEKIVPGGVQTTDGREIEVDVLVCATGFDTSYRPKFPLIGTEGRPLGQEWTANIPEAYFGIAVPGYPNYFSTTGNGGRI
jgi:cation diffusion facilitator CzcD-associated flavoprotein CzcO